MKNFALIGAAGYIAPRHMEAIKQSGNQLIAAVDIHDSVGIIDSYHPEAAFFTEIERFDRHLELLRRNHLKDKVDYVSICSPNYLHDAHIRMALRVGAHAICEKPLVMTPWNVDGLRLIEQETGQKIYNVLQLRVHDDIVNLKQELANNPSTEKADIELSYITRRGSWYEYSWKGDHAKSGGVAMNIGIHFFDMLMWLFGPVEHSQLHLDTKSKMAGSIELERARVKWFLSVDGDDLPQGLLERGQSAYRSIKIDGKELEFSGGFTDLHNKVYEDILSGGGYGIDAAEPAIQFVYDLQNMDLATNPTNAHPMLVRK